MTELDLNAIEDSNESDIVNGEFLLEAYPDEVDPSLQVMLEQDSSFYGGEVFFSLFFSVNEDFEEFLFLTQSDARKLHAVLGDYLEELE